MTNKPLPEDPEFLSTLFETTSQYLNDTAELRQGLPLVEVLLDRVKESPFCQAIRDPVYQWVHRGLVMHGAALPLPNPILLDYVDQGRRLGARALDEEYLPPRSVKIAHGLRADLRKLAKTYHEYKARLAPFEALRDAIRDKLEERSGPASPATAVDNQDLTVMPMSGRTTSDDALDEVDKAQELQGGPEQLKEQHPRASDRNMLPATVAPRSAGEDRDVLGFVREYLHIHKHCLSDQQRVYLEVLISVYSKAKGVFVKDRQIIEDNVTFAGKDRLSGVRAGLPKILQELIETRSSSGGGSRLKLDWPAGLHPSEP